MNQQTIIIINPYCHQQRGWKRWQSIKQEVLNSLNSPVKEIVVERGMDFNTCWIDQLRQGEHYCLISAGGDGSMHYLVNGLLNSSMIQRENILIGAIGLGSSNDFLKPFNKRVKGIPVRINLEGQIKNCDVGLVNYYNQNGKRQRKFFVVNASFGVTATANWNFNHPSKLLKFLQANNTTAAIAYTAIKTIFQHQNIKCSIEYDDVLKTATISNINILKIPYVSGSFWYQQDITADDGRLGLHICKDMNPINLLNVLSGLSKGKFSQGEKTMSCRVRSFRLIAAQPVVLECDGETEFATNISITVLQETLKFLIN